MRIVDFYIRVIPESPTPVAACEVGQHLTPVGAVEPTPQELACAAVACLRAGGMSELAATLTEDERAALLAALGAP
jgi:hypothetical protein